MAGGLAAAAGMNAGNAAQPGPSTLVTPSPGQNSEENAEGDTPGGTPNQGASLAAAGPGAPGTSGAVSPGNSANGAQVFGGGPIVGVASTSKDKSIRIFNKKDHYYQWQFIYDPTTDTGGLLTTPNQPSLQGATGAIQAGAPGTPGAPGTGGPGGFPGQPGGLQPGQPTQPSGLTPQMPPDTGP